MKRIDERTVELTDQEQLIDQEWNELLDKGYGINAAVDELQVRYANDGVDPDFWDYLRN